jgi:nucleotide-binding universal stress UspA family protein
MKWLVAVDGSQAALAAVRHALALHASGLRMTCVLANVQEPPTLYEMAVAHDVQRLRDLRASAGADLLRTPEQWLGAAGVGCEIEVAGGEPANVLLELAENYGCEAIVIGARGVSDPQGAGLGSVVSAVLARAALPVTVVRAPAAVA